MRSNSLKGRGMLRSALLRLAALAPRHTAARGDAGPAHCRSQCCYG
jgi:hypothetical protein